MAGTAAKARKTVALTVHVHVPSTREPCTDSEKEKKGAREKEREGEGARAKERGGAKRYTFPVLRARKCHTCCARSAIVG